MKRVFLLSCLLSLSLFASAQWRFGIGYNYIAAGTWDRAIQTYNFARPELSDRQPLLMHGIASSADYLWKTDSSLKHGPVMMYRYFRSAADNDNFDIAINAHLFSFGYAVHTEFPVKSKMLFGDVALAVICGGVFRQVNGEPLRDDGKRIWAPGIGGELRTRLGYDLIVRERFILSPYLQAYYCPFYYSPRSEAVLNQTIGLTGEKYTAIPGFELGIIFRRSGAVSGN